MQINNKIISAIFNTFDFPIRLIYNNFSFIRNILYWKLYSSNFKYTFKRFDIFKKILDENNISLNEKTVIELGPGNSFINAYLFLLYGAKKVYLIDKYPFNAFKYFSNNHNSDDIFSLDKSKKSKKQLKLLEQELNFFIEKFPDSKNIILKNNKINSEKISFISNDLSEIENLQNIDLIFSNSVLEHVENPASVIKKMHEILNPDGIILHSIDFRDHYNFSRPFLFYKYSEKIWKKYATKLGISYTNRLRYNDFIKIFHTEGFNKIYESLRREPMTEKRIDNSLKYRNDLDISSVIILAKK
jgi:SAM-dependent methyltransferase